MVSGLNFSLELQIRQLKDDIFLSQSKYVRELVKKFGLKSTKHSRTIMSTTTKFCKDTSGKYVAQKLYRSIIRSLLYLIVSRPNISFSVDTYARYQENSKESHLTIVKRIICYISGTLSYGLWYPCGSSYVIVRYFNGDWVGNIKHRKNTSCVCFTVGDCLVTWLSKKQNLISLSIAKAECIVLGSCTQLFWMKQILSDYGIKQSTMSIHCLNYILQAFYLNYYYSLKFCKFFGLNHALR